MAFCPKCNGEMESTATVCPHCGYDFPDPGRETFRMATVSNDSVAFTRLADVSLIFWVVVLIASMVLTFIAGVGKLCQGDLTAALIGVPLSMLLEFGLLTVILRAQQLGRQ